MVDIWFGFLFVKSLLGIPSPWSREKFSILFVEPRSHVRIFAISNVLYYFMTLPPGSMGPYRFSQFIPETKHYHSFK